MAKAKRSGRRRRSGLMACGLQLFSTLFLVAGDPLVPLLHGRDRSAPVSRLVVVAHLAPASAGFPATRMNKKKQKRKTRQNRNFPSFAKLREMIEDIKMCINNQPSG
jgi:hypothetical protein